jgi:hypothetical protein
LEFQEVKRHLQPGGQGGTGNDARKVNAHVNQRLGNGRTHARQHHLRPPAGGRH